MSEIMTQPTWESMCRAPEKYLPFIEQVAGFYLAFAERDDNGRIVDFPLLESAASKIPVLQALSDDELEFVHDAAIAAHCGYNLGEEIGSIVRHWIKEGACI